jgi:hypothetical protein
LGIQRIPDGYGWKDPVEAMASHFKPLEDDLSRNPKRAWWAFMDLQNVLEPRYFGDDEGREAGTSPKASKAGSFAGNDVLSVQKRWRELEKEWLGRQKAIEDKAAALGKKELEAARDFLTRYTADQAKKAWVAAGEMAGELGGMKVGIHSETISKRGKN